MFYHNLDPVMIEIFGLHIRYYGLMYVISFILTYFILIHLAKKRKLDLDKEDISDYLFYEVIGIIIGARIFYILFYNFSFYVENPTEIIAVWHGGLSFHGGFIGAIIAAFLFCRKKGISFYTIADITVIPLALGLFLGRIGNFINGELYGRVTDVWWAVKFQGVEGFRHPSQIYEACKNLFIFAVLWKLKDKKQKQGTLFWSFALLYAVLRFFVEFFRAPDVQVGFVYGLTIGQWLSVIMFTTSIIFIWRINR